jgi:hypothetical protein
MMKVQFEITGLDVPPMAFPDKETRQAVLDYVLSEQRITLDQVPQIVFTSVDDAGNSIIEQALQYGKDVTSRARFV